MAMTAQQRRLAEHFIAQMKVRNEKKRLAEKQEKVSLEQESIRLLWEQVSGKQAV